MDSLHREGCVTKKPSEQSGGFFFARGVPEDMPVFGQMVAAAVRRYITAATPDGYERALANLQKILPPSIRVRDHGVGLHGRLHVYYDEGAVLPLALKFGAHYIEKCYPDGRAEVVKDRDGSIETVKPKSFLDRLLGEDLI